MINDFTCKRCGTTNNQYGITKLCKLCNKQYFKEYYQKNKQKFLDGSKKFYKEHKEESLKYKKEYAIKHKEKLKNTIKNIILKIMIKCMKGENYIIKRIGKNSIKKPT